MKRTILAFLWVVLVLLIAVNVFAEEGETASSAVIDADNMNYENTPINKFGRGVANTATCWAEIPAEVAKVSKEKDPFLGCTLGFAQGIFTTLVRGATGLFDVVTFIIPPYNEPVMQPEYAVENADGKFKEYLW